MLLKYLFLVGFTVLFVINVSYMDLLFGETVLGWLFKGVLALCIVFFPQYNYQRGKYYEWMYIVVMLIGFFLHFFFTEIENPIADAFRWIFILIILIMSRSFRSLPPLYYIILSFYILHSIIAITEYHLQMHIFSYTYVEVFEKSATSKGKFRAFGLMGHPLQAANVQLIIMSFILVNKNINKYLKIVILLLGSYALLRFNARAAIIIWGFLLFYRLFLYKIKMIYTISLSVIIYILFVNDISLFIQQNVQIFGRLSEVNNLQDSSVNTRLISYALFWNQSWNLQDILVGGRILFMEGSDVSIENGVLLTMTWWGLLVGVFKVLLEVIISFKLLNQYNYKEKFILLSSCWLLAFTNNNSFGTFVFAFFVLSFLAMKSLSMSNFKSILITEKLKFKPEY